MNYLGMERRVSVIFNAKIFGSILVVYLFENYTHSFFHDIFFQYFLLCTSEGEQAEQFHTCVSCRKDQVMFTLLASELQVIRL